MSLVFAELDTVMMHRDSAYKRVAARQLSIFPPQTLPKGDTGTDSWVVVAKGEGAI